MTRVAIPRDGGPASDAKPMTLFQAFNAAADHIDAHPELFVFREADIPHDCATPGCALGFVHYFANVSGNGDEIDARALLGLARDEEFYTRMEALSGGGRWMFDARLCAATLRRYAERYHTNLLSRAGNAIAGAFNGCLP